MAKSDRIRAKIEELEQALKEQLERERVARKRRIGRLAERVGLTKIDIPADEIEAAFRQLVEKHGGAVNDGSTGGNTGTDTPDDNQDGGDGQPRLHGFGSV